MTRRPSPPSRSWSSRLARLTRLARLPGLSRLSHLAFRTRLALAFGGLFLLSGTALLVFVVVLARHGATQRTPFVDVTNFDGTGLGEPGPGPGGPTDHQPTTGGTAAEAEGVALRLVESTVRTVQDTALQQMVIWSAVGLVLMTVLVVLTGRWLAGRALRPVGAVTDTALRISETSLDGRLDLVGPDDELHRLADAFDSMLDRLQGSFDSQRRFVANASHELRTPLAAQRTSIEVGLADPLPAYLVETREDLLTTNREAEQLITSLLLLARSDRGLEHTERVDLAELTGAVVTGLRPVAEERGIALSAGYDGLVPVSGDPVLVRHLVANLVSNALQYNRPDGYVEVTVDGGTLTVTNTGQPIAPDQIDGLFEPFRRLGQDRTGTSGHGLGLSIVRSIAEAHSADLHAEPGDDGGLSVTVTFA